MHMLFAMRINTQIDLGETPYSFNNDVSSEKEKQKFPEER